MNLRSAAVLSLLFLASHASALDQAACSAAAKEIDDRIAAGDHPQQNVAIATQMRDGIMQSCAFMDEATLAQMLQGLDMLLPSGDGSSTVPQKSKAERDAEREAQRAQADRRQAEREKRRAAERAREAAEQELVSNVVRKPPSGRSTKAQLMSRPDRMWGAYIVDWDVYENRARLLYRTGPSREQERDADAARHYYVVEFGRDDRVVQHHIFETTLERTVTAGLIRGRDEIVVQWHVGGTGATESTLERWSISKAEMLARSTAPRLQGPRGALAAHHHFVLVSERGELLYTQPVALGTGPFARGGVSWMLASPDGEVRDRGFVERDNETVSANKWFHSTDGGAGLILAIRSDGENGIESKLQPDPLRIGDAEVQAWIASEDRLYVVGGADTGPGLPVIERQIMWMGLENVDQSMRLSGEATRLMQEAESNFPMHGSPVTLGVAGFNRTVLVPSPNGHALLSNNYDRDDAFPPRKGLWLQEFATGKPRSDTYLNPDAEHLGALFNMLTSDGGDNLYVGSKTHVLLLDGKRDVSAYAKPSVTDADIKAMIADGDSVWLFGKYAGGREAQQQVWVERIEF